ncbi:unnamed protein product [Zymoseptoria tritici ST99CH_3D1]|nr:unnamed protein product [Zymoseptoria tritici ST99CH_3D1]
MEPDTGTEAGPVINGETHDANGDTTSSEPRPDLIPRTAASLWNTAFTKVTATPEFQQQMEDSQDKKDAGRRAVMNVLADLKRTKHEPLPGYPQLAAFIGSDERSMIFRQFSELQARLILEKQDEMREIEDDLYYFDRDDWLKPGEEGDYALKPDRLTRRHRVDPVEQEQRQKMMELAERKFKEYAALLEAARSMASYEKPASYEIKNVLGFVLGTKPVRPAEFRWITEEKDLVTLRAARQHAAIGSGVEWILNNIRSQWAELAARFKIRRTHDAPTAETSAKSQGQWIKENARSAQLASWFVAAVLLLCVPVFFVVPILALSKIGGNLGQSIGVLIAFALAFTLLLDLGTPAKPHEVLSCSAAYLAVLVVFFGNVSPRAST